MRHKYIDVARTGERIRKAIGDKGMNSSQVAARMGLSCRSVKNWTLGKSIPDLNHFAMLSQVLGCTIESLIVPKEA